MNYNGGTTAMSRKGLGLVKGLVAAFVVALALAFSSAWAPAAHATEVGPLAAANLQVSGNTITCTHTDLGTRGYQVVPVTLKAGAVKLDFAAAGSGAQVDIYASANDSGSTSGTVAWVYTSDPYGTGSKYGNVAKSGTYYLMFYASKYSGQTGSRATITQFPYTAVKTAKLNGATLGTGCGNNNTVAYYKISVKKRGYLTLNVEDATERGSSSAVSLCNAKKASLVGPYYTYSSAEKPIYYGVKAGTYYIAVKSYASLYRVKPKFTAVTKAVKTSKAKAVNIPKGKKISAVMAAGEKVAWYKFKVTKKRSYTFTLWGKLFDSVRMTFSGKGYYDGSSYLSTGVTSNAFKTNTLKPGVYYIKVATTSRGNGLYSITWK